MKYVIRIGIAAFALAGLSLSAGPVMAQTHGNHGAHGSHGHHQAQHDHGQAQHDHGQAQLDQTLKPTLEDGVQVAHITVSRVGYSHARVSFEPDIPARLVFTRSEEGGCTERVRIPSLGIDATELPLGEAVEFEFTPEESATYAFTCGMDMVTGTVVVEG